MLGEHVGIDPNPFRLNIAWSARCNPWHSCAEVEFMCQGSMCVCVCACQGSIPVPTPHSWVKAARNDRSIRVSRQRSCVEARGSIRVSGDRPDVALTLVAPASKRVFQIRSARSRSSRMRPHLLPLLRLQQPLRLPQRLLELPHLLYRLLAGASVRPLWRLCPLPTCRPSASSCRATSRGLLRRRQDQRHCEGQPRLKGTSFADLVGRHVPASNPHLQDVLAEHVQVPGQPPLQNVRCGDRGANRSNFRSDDGAPRPQREVGHPRRPHARAAPASQRDDVERGELRPGNRRHGEPHRGAGSISTRRETPRTTPEHFKHEEHRDRSRTDRCSLASARSPNQRLGSVGDGGDEHISKHEAMQLQHTLWPI